MTFKSTFEKLLEEQKHKKIQRKHVNDEEHRIQCACIRWFRLQYPQYRLNLFAVPNGGYRDKTTGAKMKAEGVLAGVADIILLLHNRHYHGLAIEMKTATGKQRDSQKEWQKAITNSGYAYVVCRSLNDFILTIEEYIDCV